MTAFWIDYTYDQDRAGDGVSRYGAYVRQSSLIAECCHGDADDDAQTQQARFAAAAWATATSPVMSPGYVRCHPRLLSAGVAFNAWDASLTGSAEIVTPWPESLSRPGDWQGSTRWHGWPSRSWGQDGYRDPDDDELAAHAYLMASARLQFPLRDLAVHLPDPPFSQRYCVEYARMAVEALVIAMNAAVAPVLRALEVGSDA